MCVCVVFAAVFKSFISSLIRALEVPAVCRADDLSSVGRCVGGDERELSALHGLSGDERAEALLIITLCQILTAWMFLSFYVL